MGNKLYVGNLSFNVTNAGLEEMFAAHGTVTSAFIVTDRETKKPKGFGFVEMGSSEDAQSAIRELNGRSVDGRDLAVAEAKPQEPRKEGGGRHGRSGGTGHGGKRY